MNDTSFLYPFLEDHEPDPSQLLADLAASAKIKLDESTQLIGQSLEENTATLTAAAGAIARRLSLGGRILTFGNGGSACDAMAFARGSVGTGWEQISVRTLAADPAILSALGNDLGAEQMFSRQVEAFGGRNDTAIAFSTSGQSLNLLTALRVGRQRGLLTIAVTGYGGGAMANNPDIDYCLIVNSQSVHRIQEAQAHLSLHLRTLICDQASNTGERL